MKPAPVPRWQRAASQHGAPLRWRIDRRACSDRTFSDATAAGARSASASTRRHGGTISRRVVAWRQFPAEALPLAAVEVGPKLAPDSAPFAVSLDCVLGGAALVDCVPALALAGATEAAALPALPATPVTAVAPAVPCTDGTDCAD